MSILSDPSVNYCEDEMRPKFMMDLAERVRLKRYGQSETEAVIETLAFASSADGVLARAEKEALASAIRVLNWKRDDISALEYAQNALGTYLEMSSDQIEESIEKFCRSVGLRVTDEWLQDELYYFVARIVASDEDVVDPEIRFMTTLGAVFGIFDQRKRAIDARLADDFD